MLKEKLENFETDSRLVQHVVDHVLDDYDNDDDIKCFFDDLAEHGCVSGMVSGLIYYKDTCQFFDDYEEEIEQMITDSMSDFGYDTRPAFIDSLNGSAESITQEKNLLSWFAFEETARSLYDNIVG